VLEDGVRRAFAEEVLHCFDGDGFAILLQTGGCARDIVESDFLTCHIVWTPASNGFRKPV
jgi:hypothetical protein